MVPDFPYTPLTIEKSEIRLLRFQKDHTGSIIGWLERFSIDDPNRPKFNTLSYVWGEKHFSHTVIINGYPFAILNALRPILDAICNDENLSASWWWIDCICINQKADKLARLERSAQVHMMKKIYEVSETTIGWLGQGKEEGEDGIKFLKVLFRNNKRLQSEKDRDEKRLGDELSNPDDWVALEKLLLRPWWTRVWTLQEYIVAHKFMFYCGKESIDREKLNVATVSMHLCMKIKENLISGRAFEATWIRRRLLNWYRKRLPMHLIGLMAYIGDYRATDPRDRVYSVLGLAEDRDLADPPRYQDQVIEVYVDLVKAFIQRYDSLDIICLADRYNRNARRPPHQPSMPSWVPDWRIVTVPWVVPAMVCQSAGQHIGNFRPLPLRGAPDFYTAGRIVGPANAVISEDLRILTCRGIMVDNVDGIGGLKVVHRDREGNEDDWDEIHDYIASTSSVNAPSGDNSSLEIKTDPQHLAKLMEQVGQCILLNRKDRYLGDKSPPGYLFNEFQALCHYSLKTPGLVYPLFLDWFQRNKSLCIQGYSLAELSERFGEQEESSKINLNDLSKQTSFVSRFKDTTEWMQRRLMTTKDGKIGMVPGRTQKEDQIWVLFGCSIPLVLRKCKAEGSYEVVGECYLHGYMNGEIIKELQDGKVKSQEVNLL